ncbi:MAG: Lrp/AsnC family transcriptional regulator [Gemmatimonadetes bacterium]|nr:Lrp/AsnC family transcriptional regulator [Gemmatimonadota bacterium]
MTTIDRTDAAILGALQKNARVSNKELAEGLGLAPSSTWERVKRLNQEGVLAGFHARLAPAAVGIRLQALVAVRIGRHSLELLERFRAEVLALEEVVALYHLAGADDFLVHVAVRDADHLRAFLLAAFTTRAEVAHLETHLVFEHVAKPTIPIYAAAADP